MIPDDVLDRKDETGFEVTEPVEVDLTDVREERVLLPPTDNVKLRIRKATTFHNEDNTYRGMNISFAVEEGISVGEEVKYKGAVMFERFCYYADPVAYDKDWFKKRQHLVGLSQLLKAVGKDLKTVVNDGLLGDLAGKVVLGNVRQKPNNFTTKDGTEVSTTINTITRIRSLPVEDQV